MEFFEDFGGLKTPVFAKEDDESGRFFVASIYEEDSEFVARVFSVEPGTNEYHDGVVSVDNLNDAIAYIDDSDAPVLEYEIEAEAYDEAVTKLFADDFIMFEN